MPKVVKLHPRDYTLWGVEQYGYTINYNVPSIIELSPTVIIDVENYKDGRFAALGMLVPHCKEIFYWDDIELAKTNLCKMPRTLVGHVLRTDIHKLKKWGFKIDDRVHYDTALIEHLINSTKMKYGLKELAKEKFGIEYPKYAQIVGEGDFDKVAQDVIANYNGMDLVATYELYKSQLSLNAPYEQHVLYKELLWPLGGVLNAMEERGLAIDLEYLRKLMVKLSKERSHVEKHLYGELGAINLNSPQQVLEALHVKGITPTYKGKASIDQRGLRNLEGRYPIISQLLGFSELETLLSSFVAPLLEQGRQSEAVIHPFFSQTATRTGRLACYRPNLQQVPTHSEKGKKVKRAFVARPGYQLVELDYAAIEPRMLAHFSQSRALTELFKSGVDFHDYTSERMGIDRQKAKVLNLAAGYRMTKFGMAHQLKCSVEEADRELREWWALWPDLELWENNLISATKQSGFIATLLGRHIFIDQLDSVDKKLREKAERRTIENLAQASASEICQLAMIHLYDEGFNLVNQVHDSIVLEIEDDEHLEAGIKRACEIMENVLELSVPLICEAKQGKNWGDLC